MRLLVGLCLLLGGTGAWAQELPPKVSNAGDSISQAFAADGWPGDRTRLSWVQGTDPDIQSVYLRFRALDSSIVQEPESVSGAEMVAGGDNFAAQASRVCAQAVAPRHVSVLLGGNDVCHRSRSSTANAADSLYSVTTFRNAVRAGLDQLVACLPPGAVVQFTSVPRVDYLYEAGRQKSFWCNYMVWPVARVCRVVTGETNATRRRQIGERVNAYNRAISEEASAYSANLTGNNPSGIRVLTDWSGSLETGNQNSSVGAYIFTGGDISGLDCFHPNTKGQRKLACSAWAANPFGAGSVPACLQ